MWSGFTYKKINKYFRILCNKKFKAVGAATIEIVIVASIISFAAYKFFPAIKSYLAKRDSIKKIEYLDTLSDSIFSFLKSSYSNTDKIASMNHKIIKKLKETDYVKANFPDSNDFGQRINVQFEVKKNQSIAIQIYYIDGKRIPRNEYIYAANLSDNVFITGKDNLLTIKGYLGVEKKNYVAYLSKDRKPSPGYLAFFKVWNLNNVNPNFITVKQKNESNNKTLNDLDLRNNSIYNVKDLHFNENENLLNLMKHYKNTNLDSIAYSLNFLTLSDDNNSVEKPVCLPEFDPKIVNIFNHYLEDTNFDIFHSKISVVENKNNWKISAHYKKDRNSDWQQLSLNTIPIISFTYCE